MSEWGKVFSYPQWFNKILGFVVQNNWIIYEHVDIMEKKKTVLGHDFCYVFGLPV